MTVSSKNASSQRPKGWSSSTYRTSTPFYVEPVEPNHWFDTTTNPGYSNLFYLILFLIVTSPRDLRTHPLPRSQEHHHRNTETTEIWWQRKWSWKRVVRLWGEPKALCRSWWKHQQCHRQQAVREKKKPKEACTYPKSTETAKKIQNCPAFKLVHFKGVSVPN